MCILKYIHTCLARMSPGRAIYKFVLKDWVALPDLGALSCVLESKRFSQNLNPIIMDHPEGKRILVLAPHPDDDVFGAGGSLLKSIRADVKIKTVCITTGESEREGEAVYVRERETRKVAEALGSEIEFWHYPGRKWRVSANAKEQLRTEVHTWNPDIIFLPFLADDHEDHRRTSELFFATFKDAPPLSEIWAYQVYSTVLPNVIVDITDMIEKKIELVRMYQSQMQKRDWAHYLRGLHALNSRFLKTSAQRYAETFFVVPAAEYIDVCRNYFDLK